MCFAIIAEVSSTRLRSKTIVLACNTYNIGLIVANVLQPDMLNTDEWNWGPKAGLFWAGTCAVSMTWTYFRLPELANRYVTLLKPLRVATRQAPIPQETISIDRGGTSSSTFQLHSQTWPLTHQISPLCVPDLHDTLTVRFPHQLLLACLLPTGPTASWKCCSVPRCPLASLPVRASTSFRLSSSSLLLQTWRNRASRRRQSARWSMAGLQSRNWPTHLKSTSTSWRK